VQEPATRPASFPFDRVVLADATADRQLSPDEFFALPLNQRIQYVVQQKAAFYADGTRLDPKTVLGLIRKARAVH